MHGTIDNCFRLMHKFKAYTHRRGHTKAIVMQGGIKVQKSCQRWLSISKTPDGVGFVDDCLDKLVSQ